MKYWLAVLLLLPFSAMAEQASWYHKGPWTAIKLTGVESTVDGGAIELAWQQDSGNFWRLSFNTLGLDRESEAGENLTVKEDVSVQSLAFLHDWMPLGRYVRLTAGVVANFFSSDDFDADLEDTGQYTINGNLYSGTQVGDIEGSFRIADFAPFVGVGLLWPVGINGFISLDIGSVVFAQPEVQLRATNPAFEQVQTDVNAAAAHLEDKAGDFFTTFSLGFGAYFW